MKTIVFARSKKQGWLTKVTDIGYTYNGSLSHNLQNNSRPRTNSEKVLYEALIAANLFSFPQYKFKLKEKTIVVDFAFPRFKLAIECDGKNHNTTIQKARDETRDKLLWLYGWRVIRFKDDFILTNVKECVEIVRDEIKAIALI